MEIDRHPLALLQDRLSREGKHEESAKVKQQFLQEVRESGDFCPCKAKCELHGDCFACVQIHRGHRGHLPYCMWDMVNERIADVAGLTEGSFRKYMTDHPGCCDGSPRDVPEAEEDKE